VFDHLTADTVQVFKVKRSQVKDMVNAKQSPKYPYKNQGRRMQRRLRSC